MRTGIFSLVRCFIDICFSLKNKDHCFLLVVLLPEKRDLFVCCFTILLTVLL